MVSETKNTNKNEPNMMDVMLPCIWSQGGPSLVKTNDINRRVKTETFRRSLVQHTETCTN